MGLIKYIFRKLFRDIYYAAYGRSGKAITINNENFVVSAHVARGISPAIGDISLQLLSKLCADVEVLFDLGANIGVMSIILSKKMKPGSVIYAFEPVPNTFKYLADSARVQKGHARILPSMCAVSDRNGTLTFTDLERTTRNHLIEDKEAKGIEVASITLDSFCSDNKVIPQLIKIDIEGAEYLALLGMQQTLKNNDCTVLLEIHQEYLAAHGVTGKMFADMVNAIDYHVFAVNGQEINPEEIIKNTCVILARNKPSQEVFIV